MKTVREKMVGCWSFIQRIDLFGKIFTVVRFVLILIMLVVILLNLFKTWAKFNSGKTAISSRINEAKTAMFPSITICPGFKDGAESILKILEMVQKNGSDASEIMPTFTRFSFTREEILSSFRHGELNVLEESDQWEESIPHTRAGLCHTYNPRRPSLPGKKQGIEMTLHFPTVADPKQRMIATSIFLHNKGHFTFFEEEDMPNAVKLINSKIMEGMDNSVALVKSEYISLGMQKGLKCNEDENYIWKDCLDARRSEIRGCQAPWAVKKEIPVPTCTNVTEMIDVFASDKEVYFPVFTKMIRSNHTGCDLPCKSDSFDHDYSYVRPSTDRSGLWPITIWFPSFVSETQEEYIVCDETCLLGEVGGNFGFFLGASVLGVFDLFLLGLMHKVIDCYVKAVDGGDD